MQDGEKSPKTKVRIGFGLGCGLDSASERAAGKVWSLALCILFFLRCVHSATRKRGEEGYTDTCHKFSIGNAMEDSRCEIQCFICSIYGSNLPISPLQRGDMRVVARAAQWQIHPVKTSRSNMSRVCLGVQTALISSTSAVFPTK